MKQKNLVMLGVAMAFGLVAAIAVAKLSAGGNKGPEMEKVLVAKKDIPLKTKLEEKELDNWLMWADMPKNMVPPDATKDIEFFKGKELNRTLKAGNVIGISDVGTSNTIVLPEGCKQITLKSTLVDAVSGFAKPGAKVDVMYVEKLQSGKARAALILRDMLVLAINTTDQIVEGQGRAIPQVESISLAVTDSQARLLSLAEERGRLKFILRGTNVTNKKEVDSEIDKEVIEDIFGGKTEQSPVQTPVATEQVTTKIVFAKKAIPVNTLLNADNVAELFGTLEVKTVPEGAFKASEDLKGLYVVQPLAAGQNVMAASIGKEKIDETQPPAPVEKPEVVKAPEKIKLPRFDQVIQEGGKAKRVVWLEVAPSKWKRFDDEKEADAYVPEAPKATEENKPTGEVKPVSE